MSDKFLKSQLIKLAHSHPEFRKDLLPLIKSAGCEKLPEGGMRDNCEKKVEEGKDSKKEAGCENLPNQGMIDNCEKKKEEGKKNDKEAALRSSLIKLAKDHPEFRKDILPLLKQATFPPDSIGEIVSGPTGVPGSDAKKPWAKDEFTQQEFVELEDKQEAGLVSDGKVDEGPAKVASSKKADSFSTTWVTQVSSAIVEYLIGDRDDSIATLKRLANLGPSGSADPVTVSELKEILYRVLHKQLAHVDLDPYAMQPEWSEDAWKYASAKEAATGTFKTARASGVCVEQAMVMARSAMQTWKPKA